MDQQLDQHRARIEDALAIVERVASKLDGVDISAKAEEVRTQMREYQPTLMVYGVYNAGKSTLLNALVGEDVASVSDAPCTTEVQEVRFGDYVIYDTPGIDAPVEHETVTRAHLEKSHVVLFVVSTHGLADESKTVETLAEVVRSGRPVLLVLHDKAGLGVNSPAANEMLSKLLHHVLELLGEDMAPNVESFVVNAKTAIRARAGEKSNLMDASGVPRLAAALRRRLAATTGLEMLAPPAEGVLRLVLRLEESVREQMDDEQAAALKEASHGLRATKEGFLAAAEADLTARRVAFLTGTESALESGSEFEEVAESWARTLGQAWERRWQETREDVAEIADAFAAKMENAETVRQPRAPVHGPCSVDPSIRGDGSEESESPVGSAAKKAAQHAAMHAGTDTGREAIKRGLLQLRKLKVPFFKGRWERTLSRWAGGIGKAAGPLVTVAIAIVDVVQAQAQHEARQEAQRVHREWVKSQAAQLVADAESEAMRGLLHDVSSCIDPVRKQVHDLLGGAKGKKEWLGGALDDLAGAASDVAEVQRAARAS